MGEPEDRDDPGTRVGEGPGFGGDALRGEALGDALAAALGDGLDDDVGGDSGGEASAPPVETTSITRGYVLAKRYEVLGVIGIGATGTVLRAYDRVSRNVLAVKVLKPELAKDPRWVDRLGGEVRYSRPLQHPNVCRVYDTGQFEGHHYLTMELASGGSLSKRLEEGGDRPLAERIEDARAVVDGLAAIHAVDVVHRDVKPENVLVMEGGRLAVTDFGVAFSLGQKTIFSEQQAGTPSYMAPEIVANHKATKASDVYSLGVVLHEILFGKRPEWRMTDHGRHVFPPVGRKAPAVERALWHLVRDCLVDFVPHRLPDAGAVKARFEPATQGRMQRLTAPLRRKLPFAVAALGVAVAVGAVISRPRVAPVAPDVADKPVELTGKAVDLSDSRVLLTTDKPIRCLDALPGGKAVRVFYGKPLQAVDLDVATGAATPSALVPETYQSWDCPRLSPDGRSVLFTRMEEGKRPRIMLSRHADGRDAQPITEGTAAVWLPSGKEFVFTFDRRRAAAYSLPSSLLLFPDPPQMDGDIKEKAVDETGTLVALLRRGGEAKDSVALHRYPSMSLERAIQLPRKAAFGLSFVGSQLQLSLAEGSAAELARLSQEGRLSWVGRIPSFDLHRPVRLGAGLVFESSGSHSELFVRAPDGSERLVSKGGQPANAVASGRGDVLFQSDLPESGRGIFWAPAGQPQSYALTNGPDDAFPAFGPQGASFIYVHKPQGAVVHCALDRRKLDCKEMFRESVAPSYPAMSPDGGAVAYYAKVGVQSRLYIASLRTGKRADLGSGPWRCAPVWESPRDIWAMDATRRRWLKFDADARRQTGELPVSSANFGCDGTPDANRASPGYRVRVVRGSIHTIRLSNRI